MANSINTNHGAFVALQNLNSVNRQGQTLGNQQSTGKRVNSAVDNAASFVIAQQIRGTLQATSAVSQGISNAQGVTAVALAAGNALSDQLTNLQATVIAAQNGANTPQQQAIYAQDFQAQTAQISQTIQNASYNGTNLFNAGANSVNVLANTDGSTLTVQSNSFFSTAAANLGAQSLATTAGAQQAFSALQLAQGSLSTALGNLGSDTRTLSAQQHSLQGQSDAQAIGLGSIVDADLGRVSALATANQVQQQLATQTLSIANRNPQVLVSLFR
ncbi:MAG: flagellin [Proteobacteria bacterium]|nr:flagellin [Pseudomonadota bacterium]MBI3498008.1 flagellin [Pseudomonadota bacterium]